MRKEIPWVFLVFKMKILFVNYSIGGYAGDSLSMITIVKGLIEKGHEVMIATTDGDGYFYDKTRSKMYSVIRKKLLEATSKVIKIDGMPVYPIHSISNRFGMYCPSATKEAKKIIKKFDIVYVINWYYHLGMVFAKISHELGIPFIIAPMASLEKNARVIKKNQKTLLDRLYTNKMYKHANGFHSVGARETKSLTKLGVNSEKVFLINNGIPKPKKINAKDDSIFKKIKIDVENDDYIITVGQINEKKGLDILIEAFAGVVKKKKINLVIVGSGEEKYVTKIKELVEKFGLTKNIKFSGFVTEDEKNQLLMNAKLFVSASRSDVHPIAAIEALSCSLPVIITKESDFPEIDDFEAGMTTLSDKNSIHDSINNLLENKDELLNKSINAKKLVQEKFLLGNQIEKYETMFEEIINRNK